EDVSALGSIGGHVDAGEAQRSGRLRAADFLHLEVGYGLAGVIGEFQAVAHGRRGDVDAAVAVDGFQHVVNVAGVTEVDLGAGAATVGDADLAPLQTGATVDQVEAYALIHLAAKTEGEFAGPERLGITGQA